PRRLVELTERRFARPTVSRTFEGRDRFAPAAAWLAKGIQLTALGRSFSDYVRLDIPSAEATETSIRGSRVLVDPVGKLVSSIEGRVCGRCAAAGGVEIVAGETRVPRLVGTYADIGQGEVCALFGSTDHLELAAHAASAAEQLGLERGSIVSVRRV